MAEYICYVDFTGLQEYEGASHAEWLTVIHADTREEALEEYIQRQGFRKRPDWNEENKTVWGMSVKILRDGD